MQPKTQSQILKSMNEILMELGSEHKYVYFPQSSKNQGAIQLNLKTFETVLGEAVDLFKSKNKKIEFTEVVDKLKQTIFELIYFGLTNENCLYNQRSSEIIQSLINQRFDFGFFRSMIELFESFNPNYNKNENKKGDKKPFNNVLIKINPEILIPNPDYMNKGTGFNPKIFDLFLKSSVFSLNLKTPDKTFFERFYPSHSDENFYTVNVTRSDDSLSKLHNEFLNLFFKKGLLHDIKFGIHCLSSNCQGESQNGVIPYLKTLYDNEKMIPFDVDAENVALILKSGYHEAFQFVVKYLVGEENFKIKLSKMGKITFQGSYIGNDRQTFQETFDHLIISTINECSKNEHKKKCLKDIQIIFMRCCDYKFMFNQIF